MNARKHPIRGEDAGLTPASQPYYSTAVRVDSGPLLFVSGMVSWDDHHRVHAPGDIREQARQALRRVQKVLASQGADLADIVNITVYCVDFRHFEAVAEVRREFFPADGPASVMVQVSGLAHPDLLLEIACVAAVS